MKKIGFLRKGPTYGNDCDYSNVSKGERVDCYEYFSSLCLGTNCIIS